MLPMQNIDNKKEQYVRDFNKTFLFSSYECFCRSTQQKIVRKFYFSEKTRGKFFVDSRTHSFGY